jgi:glycosyltransferase 2 family protein
LTLSALNPIAPAQIPLIFSAFSFSWVLGLVVPGAPGGIGVFEATAIALLNSQIPTGTILGGVALYRLISILAELIGAGLAGLKTR